MKPLYVVGHKNPDCDSIVSAIAYADFLNRQNIKAEAYAQGKATQETQYLIDKYGFEHPKLITTAKCTLNEIEKDEALLVRPGITMKEALDLILSRKNKGVFVTEEDGKLLGVVSVSDLTRLWTKKASDLQKLMASVTLDNIKKVLDAKSYYEDDGFKPDGTVHIMPSMSDKADDYINSIVILRNNPDVQRFAIEAKASLLVVCGEDWIDDVTLAKAREYHVSIVHTERTVLECSRLIYQAPSIDSVTTRQVISFYDNETVEEVGDRMAKSRFRTYPVLNDKNQVVAAVSRYHLFNYEHKRFILVDHNENTQTVNDMEFGEICGIVDHHRMGGLETSNPINIIERVVGSTATIITTLYQEKGYPISKNLAGLLLGGVVSDTMCLKSPTTTPVDIEAAKYLAKIAKITPEELHQELINAVDSILKKSDLELMYDDFKEFRINGSRVAIGQSFTTNFDDYFKIKDRFLSYVEDAAVSQHYDLILIMFTDPRGSGSYFLYTGKKSWVIDEGFHDLMNEKGFSKGIISRKKQVLPRIIDTMNQ